MRVRLGAAAILLLLAVPAAQGHGSVNARELETLIVEDEASDVVTGVGLGYDLVQIYLGEAFVPDLGDGLYVHTVLYGGPGEGRPLLDGPLAVRFTFTTDKGEFVRTLSTPDGAEFTSDFDKLELEAGDGEVELRRAFVVYPDGMGPGTVLQTLKAESLVGDELRDAAPGGIFLPGVGAEVPMGDSAQVVESYTFKGPVGYVEAKVRVAGGSFVVDARNPLKSGDQHILFHLPDDLHGWQVDATPGGEVKAGQNASLELRLVPGTGPLRFDLITDIGGRLPLEALQGDDHVVLRSPDGDASIGQTPAQESPSPLWLVSVALALAFLVRKAQR